MGFEKQKFRHLLLAVVLASGSAFTMGCGATHPTIPPNAVTLQRLGADALSKGDLDGAIARLSLALEYHPNFVEAWITLGMVDLARGDLIAADRRFRRALTLDRDAAMALVGMGAVAERKGEFAEAEAKNRAALAIDPGLFEPRANLAHLLVRRGALDEARDHLKRLVEIQSEDPAGYVALAEVLWRMDREAEAASVVRDLEAIFPDRPETELLRARRDLRAGEALEAKKRLEPLVKRPGALGRAAGGWLGIALIELGDCTAATLIARYVLGRDPNDALSALVMKTCSSH